MRLILCLSLLVAVQVRVAWLRVRPAELGRPITAQPRVAIERVGEGLACVADAAPYSRTCSCAACGSMSVARRLLIGAPLDTERMSAREWELLPGIGPQRAAQLVRDGPRSFKAPTGIVAQLTSALGLDEKMPNDICSLGSWPTTSSGCDRPR